MRYLYLIISVICTFSLASSIQQLKGVNWSIRDRNYNCKGYDEVLADFTHIATFSQSVKIYGLAECDIGNICMKASQAAGINIFLGISLGPIYFFEQEFPVLQQLVSQGLLNNVLGISVGSEDLYRNEPTGTVDLIVQHVKDVQKLLRDNGLNTPVTHTDAVVLPQAILDVVDIYMYNIFPYWMGVDVDNSLQAIIDNYNYNLGNSQGKPLWIGETGWPTGGRSQQAAVPSEENAGIFLEKFICWANQNNIPYFYFEAYDDLWKASQGTGDIETTFGMYHWDRTPKSFVKDQYCTGNVGQISLPSGLPTRSTAAPTLVPSTTSQTPLNSQNPSTVNPTSSANSGASNANSGNTDNSATAASTNSGSSTSPSVQENPATTTIQATPTPAPSTTAQSATTNNNDSGANDQGQSPTAPVARDQPGNAVRITTGVLCVISAVMLL